MFRPLPEADLSGQTATPASDTSRRIVLCADSRLTDWGLLGTLLPVFEYRYGYTVEVLSAPAEDLPALCAGADMAILPRDIAGTVRAAGPFRSLWPYASSEWIKE